MPELGTRIVRETVTTTVAANTETDTDVSFSNTYEEAVAVVSPTDPPDTSTLEDTGAYIADVTTDSDGLIDGATVHADNNTGTETTLEVTVLGVL